MTNEEEATSSLTDAQEAALALVPVIPAILSMTGSLCIIRLVIRAKLSQPQQRLLFVLSLYDIFNSITVVLQTFLVPRSTSRRRWAIGNEASCSAMGFAFQFSYPSFIYFGLLSFYFLLVIRFGIRDELFARRIEPWMHLVGLLYPTVTAIIGLAMDLYDEVQVGAGCWLAKTTESCDVDCMSLMEWIFGGIPFGLIFISIVINNLVIFWYVRRTLRRSLQRQSLVPPSEAPTSRRDSQSASSNTLTTVANQEARIRAVATQAFLYVGVFFLIYLWTLILRLMSNQGGGPSQEARLFPVMILRALFLPSMGLGTVLVYSRPRYMQIRLRFPYVPRWWALRRVLLDHSPQTDEQSAINYKQLEHEKASSSSRVSWGSFFFSKGSGSGRDQSNLQSRSIEPSSVSNAVKNLQASEKEWLTEAQNETR